ncbi:MAG TPA: hypothetical protein VNF73_10835, partial [Candidatus Saccharimonadales bacterium]|nr:hypothetical protein [Candidatus Saccharimonadales bacterium]
NGLQQYGWAGAVPGGRLAPFQGHELGARWRAFGWRVLEIDGHDPAAILHGLTDPDPIAGRPTVVLARTVKGKGVPFMEGEFSWHARVPTDAELELAMRALGEGSVA